jgi:hypothetical protein
MQTLRISLLANSRQSDEATVGLLLVPAIAIKAAPMIAFYDI